MQPIALPSHAGELFQCPVLGCSMRAVICIARQIASELEVGKGPAPKRSSRAKRGRVGEFVSCKTEMCPVGARLRGALGDLPEAVKIAGRAPRASDTAEN